MKLQDLIRTTKRHLRNLRTTQRMFADRRRIFRAKAARLFGEPMGWLGYSPRTDLPQFLTFQNITVAPGQSTIDNGFIAVGGPIWPDFEDQTTVRFNRQGLPIDQRPTAPPHLALQFATPCLWGGFAFQHFGHFTAEVVGRVILSIRQRATDTVLFIALPGLREHHYPSYFWDLLDWCGLPVDRVKFVTTPLLCSELRVMPEPEQLNYLPPFAGYLSLLDENAARNRLVPVPNERLYVARSKMLGRGGGCHAGESYLVDLLQKAGVAILYPEQLGLRAQLALYAGAKVIVFAEGSAIHGRQLLGWYNQHIMILNRRKSNQMALHAMTARCAKLTYCEAAQVILTPVCAEVANMSAIGLSIYDRQAVIADFASIGVDLAPLWDNGAYHAWLRRDVQSWQNMIGARSEPIDMQATLDNARRELAAVGLTDIA